MTEPKRRVEEMEQAAGLRADGEERFIGYGVMGLPFRSGYVLGMRRFPRSSLGQGYTSVWVRDPAHRWRMYQDVDPALACPRYFGSALVEASVRDILTEWTDPWSFTITVDSEVELEWRVELSTTAATWALSSTASHLPEGLWRNETFLKLMGSTAGVMLRAGHLGLSGRVPNGQQFFASPRQLWVVASSQATLKGHDLGPIGPLPRQSRLGDFWIPQRGLFAIGAAAFEPLDPQRHQVLPSTLMSV